MCVWHGYNSSICVHSHLIGPNGTQSPRLLSKFYVRSSAFHFSQKILLITYVECNLVCRTNSQLQVLSCFPNATCRSRAHSPFHICKMECMHAIKCLEPHAIYHEDDTCVQTELKSTQAPLLCSLNCSGSETKIALSMCLLSSAFHSFPFFSCLISFPVVNITHSCSLNICIPRTSYNLKSSCLFFTLFVCACVLGSNI